MNHLVKLPEATMEHWAVKRLIVSKAASELDAIRGMFNGGRYTPPGEYTALYRGNTLVMSDTPDEWRDHAGFVRAATGRVLIAGLGIGMVLKAVLAKPEVTHATVIEVAPEVVKLVGAHYCSSRCTIILASIFDWDPPNGEKWDAAWFDVWDNLSTDNLAQMTRLKRKFARRATWKGCWGEPLIRRRAAHERRHAPWWSGR